jgi:hypothetical protein
MRDSTNWLAPCRVSEQVAVCFFVYTALLSLVWGLAPWKAVVAVGAPIAILALARMATANGSRKSAIAREWFVPALVLVAYWEMGWFASDHDSHREAAWLAWDRTLLESWGLKSFLEGGAAFLPWWLELSYLSLYAIPPACLGILYWRRQRPRVDRFLTTFALGTLTAYALLPVIPVRSPRIAFPGADLPEASSVCRSINLWILNHLDISTSVFPSGHVAVAFSSAFGIERAIPENRRIFGLFLALASMIFVGTIYGRYHYAADGLASLLICLACWGVSKAYDRNH